MTWIATFTGRKVNPCNLRPDDVCIEDIAHHLACLNRFTGATRVPISVAEHCVRMSRICPPELALECLLHDATEAYLNDQARPVKPQLHNFRNLEEKAEVAIRKALGLPGREHPQAVKSWDNVMLVWEARDLDHQIEEKYSYIEIPEEYGKITPWGWKKAEREFLARYEELTAG